MECREKLWNSNYVKIWTANFMAHFSFTLIVPLLPLYLSQSFGADKETIGVCLAGYTIMAIVVRPFCGYVVDTFPRKAVLLISNFIFVSLFAGYLAAGSLAAFTLFRTVHGAPFGALGVSASTVAIDVLPPSRRAEGIGYYGLSHNLATATGPVLAVYVLKLFEGNFNSLFWLSILVSLVGLVLDSTIKMPSRDYVLGKKVISLDRFFLLKGWRESIAIVAYGISYGILSTYVAIYGKEELGLAEGTGLFFTLFAIGLIISRLAGARNLKKNAVSRNAAIGIILDLVGYAVFASFHGPAGYYAAGFIIGLGNGHMFPAFQTMFINLAPNNQRGTANSSILTAWDAGIGLGVLAGGCISERFGYHPAFWTAVALTALGVAYFYATVRNHFETNKLR